jgi:uncharacterized membrane protein
LHFERPVWYSPDRLFIFQEDAIMTKTTAVALFIAILCAAPLSAQEPRSGTDLGGVQGGDFSAAHGIIEKRCTKCHSGKRIDAALSSGKDMSRIQREMEKKGAKLNTNEREVLGIYWKQQNPLKQKK